MQLALECEERVCVGRGSETGLTLGIHVPPGATGVGPGMPGRVRQFRIRQPWVKIDLQQDRVDDLGAGGRRRPYPRSANWADFLQICPSLRSRLNHEHMFGTRHKGGELDECCRM